MKLHPGYEQRPDDPKFVDCVSTPLTEAQATYYLKNAWKRIYGVYPSKNSLAILWAQSAGETGRWKYLRCNNWGNIKKRGDNKYTSYEAGEILNGKQEMFYPYHPQTFFSAWDTPIEGAEAYIRFVSQRERYKKAWVELMAGDPVAYCAELKKAGYFTASLDLYARGVVRLVNEFKRKYDDLNTWAPQPPPAPAPEPPEPEPEPEPEPAPEPEPDPEPEPEPIEPDVSVKPNLGFIAKLLNLLKSLLTNRR